MNSHLFGSNTVMIYYITIRWNNYIFMSNIKDIYVFTFIFIFVLPLILYTKQRRPIFDLDNVCIISSVSTYAICYDILTHICSNL